MTYLLGVFQLKGSPFDESASRMAGYRDACCCMRTGYIVEEPLANLCFFKLHGGGVACSRTAIKAFMTVLT